MARKENGEWEAEGPKPKADTSPATFIKVFMSQAILGFFGPFRYLSNFEVVTVEFDGELYRSTEHAYMAAKSLDLEVRKLIQDAPTPRDAKKLGMKIQLREDWGEIKFDVMRDVLIQKFTQEPYRTKLLETGDAYLEETNTWGDVIWGVCNGVGQNNLGKTIMEIRSWLKEYEAI